MWIVIASVCSLVILIITTMLCLCWRKKTQKNDLLGLDGLVTQKNPDENVNHLPSAVAQIISDGIKNVTGDTATASDANKSNNKPVTVNNPRRSLPDIPSDGVRNDGDLITYEPNGDNSSDLYATVEPYQNSTKRHTLPNGIDSQPSISQHSSISQADDTFSPYARVREHPYDKLLKTEHPYARVQPSNSSQDQGNSSGEATPKIAAIRTERISIIAQTVSLGEPTALCRSRRSSGQSSVVSDIPAASAVAGGIAANQELPYMTPPIIQPNFSGDSQDSSKGYTSISVREPLANIRAQTKVINKLQGGDMDPHYSTVSDDSDDMYTTIQDPNNTVYTSGSETYAQIEPPQVMVAAEVNPNITSSTIQLRDDELCAIHLQEHVPQPASFNNFKHVTHTHSRQASSSSLVMGNAVGSPKPEKRQANSPLPPPPPIAANSDLQNITDKLSTCRNLDDMYAKVQKGKKKNDKDEQDLSRTSVLKDSESLQGRSTSYSDKIGEYEQNNESVTVSSTICNDSFLEHNYETLKKSPRKGSTDSGYEKLKPREHKCVLEPGYDMIGGPNSILSSDPGYEVLKHSNEMSLEADPNYEELKHGVCTGVVGHTTTGTKSSIHSSHENNGYSVVNKQSKQNSSSEEVKSKNSSSYESDGRDLSTDEPNYESMPSESLSEHNYAILKSTGSESDPNYESVYNSDPNYESVKYLDVTLDDPPYHQLLDEDSSKSSEWVLMENTGSKIDIGYEKVNTETEKILSTKENLEDCESNTDPGYETIKNDKDNSSVNLQLENDYDGIVQV